MYIQIELKKMVLKIYILTLKSLVNYFDFAEEIASKRATKLYSQIIFVSAIKIEGNTTNMLNYYFSK